MQVTQDRVQLTGGPVWHWRALRRRGRLWKPFRVQVEDWLAAWQMNAREIILVGPSAGWCLPNSFLARFERILAVDLDRHAPLLFHVAHHAVARRVTWLHVDVFASLEDIMSAHPEAAILFCNVAGQRRYVVRDIAAVEAEMAGLKHALAGRHWASFHDLLSGSCASEREPVDLPHRMDHTQILQRLNLAGEWLDHLTSDLLPEQAPRKILPWRFGVDRFHIVEAGIGGA